MTMLVPDMLDDDADYALDDLLDLDERLARLRATKPAAWVRCFGQPAIIFTSYELVHAAFKDETTFPSAEFYGNVVTDVMAATCKRWRAASTASIAHSHLQVFASGSCHR